jgi:hypothetical protein
MQKEYGARTAYVDKIYARINFRSDVDREDPDYHLISHYLEEIPSRKDEEFYAYLMSPEHGFVNEKGYLALPSFVRAVKEFREQEEGRLWEKHDLAGKLDRLMKILSSLKNFLYRMDAESGVRLLRKFDSDLSLVKFRTPEDGNEESFRDIEEEVIREAGGLYALLSPWVSGDKGYSEVFEVVENAYRTIISRHYLFGHGANRTSIGSKGSNSKNLPQSTNSSKKKEIDISHAFKKF